MDLQYSQEDKYSIPCDCEQCIMHLERNRMGPRISHFYTPYRPDILDLSDIQSFYKYHMDFLGILISKYILVGVDLLNTRHFVRISHICKGLDTPYQYMLGTGDIHHHSYILVLRKSYKDHLRIL